MLLLPFSSHGETDVMSWNYRSEIAVFDMSFMIKPSRRMKLKRILNVLRMMYLVFFYLVLQPKENIMELQI